MSLGLGDWERAECRGERNDFSDDRNGSGSRDRNCSSSERNGRNANGAVNVNSGNGNGQARRGRLVPVMADMGEPRSSAASAAAANPAAPITTGNPVRLYAYGVARNRLPQSARRLHVPASIMDDFGQAEAIVTLKNYYRRRPRLIVDAERRGTPIYVLRANTVSQMEAFLIDLFGLDVERNGDAFGEAMAEAKAAIQRVRGGAEYVDLLPQDAETRRRQHEMARDARLYSESQGAEPQRHVRILRD